MDEQDNKPPEEPQGTPSLSADEADVRLTIELTRQAIEASAAEIERAKRLRRETEELGNQPVPPPAHPNDGEPS